LSSEADRDGVVREKVFACAFRLNVVTDVFENVAPDFKQFSASWRT
jgi:hypothetical protein